MHVQGYSEARSRDHCCHGKAVSIKCFECLFVALGVKHAMHMRRIILSCVACPALLYFSTYHKRHVF